jgi:hypothetical protein
MDIKNPLYWYSGVIIFTCLNIMAMALFINTMQTYKKQSEDYYPNHMKYKYMKLFWGGETSKVMNELDAEYEANSVKHDNEIIKREHDIDVANATAAKAKLQREAAAKAEQEAREAAKKIH